MVFGMETAFLLALAIFVAGLVLLHFGRQTGSGLLRAAALVAIVGSVASAAETTYYGIRYYAHGDFDSSCPMLGHGMSGGPGWMGPHGMMGPGMGPGMMGPHGAMGPGRMGPGRMGPGRMGGAGAPGAQAPAPPPAAEPPSQ
jgi:hypothetical protein